MYQNKIWYTAKVKLVFNELSLLNLSGPILNTKKCFGKNCLETFLCPVGNRKLQ